MNSRLIGNSIKHSDEYNPGGIAEILILNINDFISYRFSGDGLYNSCMVEKIYTNSNPISIDCIVESNFTEQEANNIYTQTLSSFIRSLDAKKTNELIKLKTTKQLVLFRTYSNTWHTFGADCGASLVFEQISGQVGESNGYKITLTANSIFPLFEVADRPIFEIPPVPEIPEEPEVEEIFPDPFVRGKREDRLLKVKLDNYNANFEDPRDWDQEDIVRSAYSVGTYPIQEIDEYWWFAKPLMTDYRYRLTNDTYLNWLGYSDKEIQNTFSNYLKTGKELDNDSLIKSYGSPVFLREGVANWLNQIPENATQVWNIYRRNPEIVDYPIEELLAETPIEKLDGFMNGGALGDTSWKWLAYRDENAIPMINNKILTKVVLFFHQATDFQLEFYGDDMEKVIIPLRAESAGRHEFDINVETGTNTSLIVSVKNGKIRIGEAGVNPIHNKQLYYFGSWDQWGYGLKDWDLGIGIYGKEKNITWLTESVGKWVNPELDDIFQLIGQAPVLSETFYQNVIDFIGADSVNDGKPLNFPHARNQALSGFDLYPTGAKGGGYKGSGDKPPIVGNSIEESYVDAQGEAINRFGEYGAIHTGNYRGNINGSNWTENTHKRILFVSGAFDNRSKYIRIDAGYPNAVQSAQVRYCTKKTDEELGYKMFIDETNDQIIMVNYPLSQADLEKTTNLEELPKGMLRGIALRYTNRLHREVCKSLSEMRAEEQEITNQIIFS